VTGLTYQEMLRRYDVIHRKAKAVERLIRKRMEVACKASGIDPCHLGTAGHNAMIDFRNGRPWAGVDYHLLRKARWLAGKSFGPNRVAQAAWSRLYDEWRNGGFQYDR
jgi:hypothetical protein